MKTAEKLLQELEKVFTGQPWYGLPIYSILDDVAFKSAFEKPGNTVHNIAEILLHMLSWTQEVSDRMQGKPAGTPKGGDWPEAGDLDEQKWQNWVNGLKLANVNLIGIIQHSPDSKWNSPINHTRESEPIISYEELIYGFIQHQIYHAGQISILNRLING